MTTPKADPQSTDSSTARETLQSLVSGFRGYMNLALIYVAAKLRIVDLLANGPQKSDEIALSVGAHAPSLHRILRGLVALGIFSEEDDWRFGLTEVGTGLRTEAPDSPHGRVISALEEWGPAWGGLLHTAMTGETAFNHVLGMSIWEHQRQHPELSEYFNQRMAQKANAEIVAAYDFLPFRRIADVGGNQGALLAAILKTYPAATGILFDQPHVVAGAGAILKEAGVAARCQVVGGSFFEGIPHGADLHILRSIIHDWDDKKSLTILRNCRRALNGSGTLLLAESIMPTRVDQAPDMIWSDLSMMVLNGSRERTEAEYRALFEASGFKLTRVVSTECPRKPWGAGLRPTPFSSIPSRISLIEGVPA
ncbi:MAG: hypothetical protein A3F84_13925 [Candidatus Handelsmanbacteria bacterium RIFCSPLOWO2_12_FULL_64_10]|uniref:Methyltransferase n=1 Tax=Handelsmanbacteria sp. (strain RIFCSPLOWO2_12_FULL_64_10) TaxID=1817868 RepID=A0A1F6CD14_HANXR|nr:MAG: hypothetical protein A3F84_13925 [Candidatus Handelsmanbacteria bacterium RIFCSPLOWO2_12_FULL_64_10]